MEIVRDGYPQQEETNIPENNVNVKDITYDPNKKYKWTPTDEINLSGAEFGILINSLRSILGTVEAQQILLAKEANNVVENILARNVESGVIVESE